MLETARSATRAASAAASAAFSKRVAHSRVVVSSALRSADHASRCSENFSEMIEANAEACLRRAASHRSSASRARVSAETAFAASAFFSASNAAAETASRVFSASSLFASAVSARSRARTASSFSPSARSSAARRDAADSNADASRGRGIVEESTSSIFVAVPVAAARGGQAASVRARTSDAPAAGGALDAMSPRSSRSRSSSSTSDGKLFEETSETSSASAAAGKLVCFFGSDGVGASATAAPSGFLRNTSPSAGFFASGSLPSEGKDARRPREPLETFETFETFDLWERAERSKTFSSFAPFVAGVRFLDDDSCAPAGVRAPARFAARVPSRATLPSTRPSGVLASPRATGPTGRGEGVPFPAGGLGDANDRSKVLDASPETSEARSSRNIALCLVLSPGAEWKDEPLPSPDSALVSAAGPTSPGPFEDPWRFSLSSITFARNTASHGWSQSLSPVAKLK